MKGLVVIPACNEGVSLVHFLPRLRGQINQLKGNSDVGIVVIDDGSTDDTPKIVHEMGYALVRNSTNQGLGVSLRKGYAYALEHECDYVVTMDADGQHDVRLLPSIINQLENADLVTASRYHPESQRFGTPLDRELLNIAVTAKIHSVTGWHHITDPLTGFWCMKSWIADFLVKNLKLERYGTCLEALIKLWYLSNPRPKIVEVAHPSIYSNEGGFLNRVYSPANAEDRLDRFGTHALHILKALWDVQASGKGQEIEEAMNKWRKGETT